MRREIEEIVLLFARRRQAFEVFRGDDHVTGRARHGPFARPFERLAIGLRDVQQHGAWFSVDLTVYATVGEKEANEGHETHAICSRAVRSMWRHAEINSASPV